MPSISDQTCGGRGKRWAYAGAIVGGVVSVAANVAHSFVPVQPAGLGDDAWRLLPEAHPRAGAVLLAAFWPCALLLALEVVARVDWPNERRWTAVRWGGLTPVALVAAVVSYQHLAGLARWYGEGASAIVPIGIDGLMVVCSGALIALAGRSDRVDSIGSAPAPGVVAVAEGDALTSTVADTIVDRVEDLIGSDGSDRIEYPIESSGSDASVVPIGSHRYPEAVTRSSQSREAREDDVARVRAALKAGDLTEPLRVSHVMDHLAIGPTYARAAVEHVNAHGSQEQAEAQR